MRPLLVFLLFLSVSCSSTDDVATSADASIDTASDSVVADSESIDSITTDSSSSDTSSADSMTVDSATTDSASTDTQLDDGGDGGACVSMCSASYCPSGKKCCVEHSGPGGTPCAVCVCLGCACTL